MKIRKILRRTLFFFISLFVLFSIAVAIALNFVFTPEKITPTVTEMLNENLNAKVNCESIELTFFTTFPSFGITLKNGSLVTPSFRDRENDTLARFTECRASFNISKLLTKHNLVVNELSLTNPKIKAVIRKDGKANWNIVKETETNTIVVNDTTSSFKINSVFIKKLSIENAKLSYHDFVTKAHVRIDSFNVALKAANTNEKLMLTTQTSGKRINFSKDGVRFARKLKASLNTKIFFDKKNMKVDFDKSELVLNDIGFLAEGHFSIDTLKREVDTDITLEMKVPSLKTLWEAIPRQYVKQEDVDVEGNVALKAVAKGIYGQGKFPLTDIEFKIDNGILKYNKFPGEIRHLEADMHSVLNFNEPEKSNLTIKNLLLEGTGVNLQGNAVVESLLEDPKIDSNIKGELDLTTLKKKFPVAADIDIQGVAQVDLNAVFKNNDIINSNFNNMKLKGHSTFTNLLVSVPKDTIYLKTQKTELVFGRKAETDSRKAFGKINVTDLTLNYKEQHDLTLAGLDIKLRAKMLKDSMAALGADIKFTNLKYKGIDSLKGAIRRANITAELSPRSTKERPAINTTFSIDSAGVWQGKRFVGIKNGNYKFTVKKNRDEQWMPRGYVEFNSLFAYTPEFAMPMRMEHSKVTINNRAITLKNARITFGNSDVTLTGQINNLFTKRSQGKDINAKLTLQSNYIDANEIMKVMHDNEPEAQPDFNTVVQNQNTSAQPTTTEKAVFKIPENINFEFNSDIKKLRYGELDMTDIKGLLKVEEGHLKLNEFELTTLAAKLTTSINYTPVDNTKAKVDFDFNLHDIEMANIAKVLPAMDSLFPMTKSFEGKAHLRMQGTAMLNEDMTVNIPTVRSIAALQATDIMVLDSETFTEMAKTLMFKQKEKNTIETLEMEMIIEQSHMEVLPALVEIDRYRLAVGGVQNLDLTYDYHVSVLKSPIPFKTGVNIKGNLDDYNISLGKAKYKYYFTDKERLKEKADESIINKKKKILAQLQFE